MNAKKKQWTAAAMGRKGGKRRLETMTTEQRKAVAKLGGKARWSKRKGT